MAEGQEDGLPVYFRFRDNAPVGVEISEFPRLMNVYWRCESPENEGMPTAALHDQMTEFEMLLDPIEGPNLGFMVLSITGNHRKEWIWYIRNDQKFLDQLNAALSGKPPFPIEIEGADDPGWKSYLSLLDAVNDSVQ